MSPSTGHRATQPQTLPEIAKELTDALKGSGGFHDQTLNVSFTQQVPPAWSVFVHGLLADTADAGKGVPFEGSLRRIIEPSGSLGRDHSYVVWVDGARCYYGAAYWEAVGKLVEAARGPRARE